MAMANRYTAVVKHNKKILFKKSHADFQTLQASLLVLLQDKFDGGMGFIIDNLSGQTVSSHRKVTCYD